MKFGRAFVNCWKTLIATPLPVTSVENIVEDEESTTTTTSTTASGEKKDS